jgi:GT2 family glycosyltransferase
LNSEVKIPGTRRESIYTVLLNWNGKEDTLACLASLAKTEYLRHTVVVVDNGSTDGSQDRIRGTFPDVVLIQNERNLGFTGGNNVGIEYGLAHGADFVYLLNNDTVVDPRMFDELLKVAHQYPHAGILGAKIYYFDQPRLIWFAGGKWTPERAWFRHVGKDEQENDRDWEQIRETDYACGCAMFVRAEVFRRIGLLDPRFFILWEECDFCYRAKRSGYPTMFVPQAKVWHKISSTFGHDVQSATYLYFWWRNRLLWMERNLRTRERLRLMSLLVGEAKGLVNELRNPKTGASQRAGYRGALVGIRDYLLRRFGDCPSSVRRCRA